MIDELGYMELDRRGAELLFQVLTEREEYNSIASPQTSRSPTGRKLSPTPGSAPRSSTDSPSTASSRPAPIHTGSLTPASRSKAPDQLEPDQAVVPVPVLVERITATGPGRPLLGSSLVSSILVQRLLGPFFLC